MLCKAQSIKCLIIIRAIGDKGTLNSPNKSYTNLDSFGRDKSFAVTLK